MHDYDPLSQRVLLKDIAIAWVIALAVFAMLLLVPEFTQRNNNGGVDRGLETAIDQIIPRDTEFVAESRKSP